MHTFNIFFSDLVDEAQERLMAIVGITDPKEMNWDMDITPIATIYVEKYE